MKARNLAINQFILWDDDRNKFLQSYDSIIVKINHRGDIYLDEYYWDYSKTTGRYRNQFLGETKNETLKKIKSGKYKLINLNK